MGSSLMLQFGLFLADFSVNPGKRGLPMRRFEMKRKKSPLVRKVHGTELRDLPHEKAASLKDQQSIDYWIALAQLH